MSEFKITFDNSFFKGREDFLKEIEKINRKNKIYNLLNFIGCTDSFTSKVLSDPKPTIIGYEYEVKIEKVHKRIFGIIYKTIPFEKSKYANRH